MADPPVDPPEGIDENKLTELIGKVVGAEFDKRKAELPAPPAAPAAPAPAAPAGGAPQPPGDLASFINSAVDKALRQRDESDQLAVLADQIDKLQKMATTSERRRSWGSWIVGRL